jgi:uncharacterized RDD family membrane protein YckC
MSAPSATERRFSAETLHVSPELVGQPLASPVRRLLALVVDFVILWVPMVAVALAAAYASLALREPAALRAIRVLSVPSSVTIPAEQHRQALQEVLPLLVRLEAPGLPPAAVAAFEEGEVGRAVTLLEGYDFTFSLKIGESAEAPRPPKTIVFEAEKTIPKGLRPLAIYGVAALYFTLFLSYGAGATPGKRLLGIRVVHLGGERLSLLEALERYAGYVEILATAGFALAALWKDPNRRLPHDRVAHTVVLRVKRAGRTEQPLPAEAPPGPPSATPDAPSAPTADGPQE